MSKLYIGQNNIAVPVKTAYYGINNKAVKVWEAEEPTPPTPVGEIYGVEWNDISNSQWARTDASAEFPDPEPYDNNTDTPFSPFDNIMPWSGMVKSVDPYAGEVVSIPKFYYKLTQVNSGLKIQISSSQQDGFSVSPAHMNRGDGNGERDTVYVGAYHCDSSFKSTSGVYPYVNQTRESFRSNIHNLGSTIWQWDFATRFTIWLLYLVEFANWDSQDKIGYGCGNNSSVERNGSTDSTVYHTGTNGSARGSASHVKYRNIEGLWDNVHDWLDGCYYVRYDTGLNIILNPSQFSDSSNGISVGDFQVGYPIDFSVKQIDGTFPMFVPNTSQYSSTAVCDQWWLSGSNIYAGGSWRRYSDYGLFHLYGSSGSYAYVGSRLMILP